MFALIGPHFAIPFEFEFLEQIYSSMDGRNIVSIGPFSSAIIPNRDTRPSIWPFQEEKATREYSNEFMFQILHKKVACYSLARPCCRSLIFMEFRNRRATPCVLETF